MTQQFFDDLLVLVEAIADEKSRSNMGQDTLTETIRVREIRQDMLDTYFTEGGS